MIKEVYKKMKDFFLKLGSLNPEVDTYVISVTAMYRTLAETKLDSVDLLDASVACLAKIKDVEIVSTDYRTIRRFGFPPTLVTDIIVRSEDLAIMVVLHRELKLKLMKEFRGFDITLEIEER